MNITKMLSQAIELELKVSECYEKMSQMTPYEALKLELKKLGKEELVHANLLRTGRRYASKDPDFFHDEHVSDQEIEDNLHLIGNLIQNIENKTITIDAALKKICELESRCEKVHMARIVETMDPSLKKLFEALSAGDREHTQRLEKIACALK
jgi:rubrerythrin